MIPKILFDNYCELVELNAVKDMPEKQKALNVWENFTLKSY